MKQLEAGWVEYDLTNAEDLKECLKLVLIRLDSLDTLLQNKDNINALTMQGHRKLQYLRMEIEQRKEDKKKK